MITPYFETENGKLYNANCLDIMPELEPVDLVFTSPPYNRKRNDKYNKYDDVIANYFSFLCNTINQCLAICKGNVFVNIQKNSYNKIDVHRIFGEYASKIIEVIIWHKSNPMPNPYLINAYEYIIVLSECNKALKANKTYTLNHFTTPVYSNNPYKNIHRAVMHPDACNFIIKNFSKQLDIIIDPFFGLGTTAIACERLNRRWIGIEISEEYCEIAKLRIQKELKLKTKLNFIF